jgi:hypothetical protein
MEGGHAANTVPKTGVSASDRQTSRKEDGGGGLPAMWTGVGTRGPAAQRVKRPAFGEK